MGKQRKQLQTLFCGAPKSLQMVTVAIKLRHLLLGRKVMTNLDSILKSGDITFPTKVRLVKAFIFPVVMYGCELSAKNWCFCTVVLKTLESPLDYKKIQPVHPKGNQSWIFIGRDWCWSWNSNTLATWCEELTHLKRPWCWEWLKVGGEGDNKGWDGWMPSLTQWTWVWVSSRSSWWTGKPGMWQSMGSQRIRHNWATEQNWMVEMSLEEERILYRGREL